MKKKRRYFSVVVVILLLANNTSGAAQVIAEELSKNNSSVEKIESSSEEQTAQSSNSEATEETNNSSEEQRPPSSSEKEQSKGSEVEEESQNLNKIETSSENKVENEVPETTVEKPKSVAAGKRTTEEEKNVRTETRGNMSVSVSGNVFTFTLNNTNINELRQYMVDHDDQITMETEMVLNGSFSEDATINIPGQNSVGLKKYLRRISGNISYLPQGAFGMTNEGIKKPGDIFPTHPILDIDLPNLRKIGKYAFAGTKFSPESKIYMPSLEEIGYSAFGNSFGYPISPDEDFNFYVSTSLPNELSFPELRTVGGKGFEGTGNTNFKKFDAPKLTNIGTGVFVNHWNLVEINAPKIKTLTDSPTSKLEFSLIGVSNMELNELEEVSDMMFQNDLYLKKLKIPNVKKIGSRILNGGDGSKFYGPPKVHVLKLDTPSFESIKTDAFDGSNLRGVLYNGTENNKKIFDVLNTTNRDGNRINFYGYKENIPDSKAKPGEKLSIPIVDLPEKVGNAAEDSFKTYVWKNGNYTELKLQNGELQIDDFKPEDAGEYDVKIEIRNSETGEAESFLTNKFKVEVAQEQLLWGTSPWSFDEESGILTVEPGELAANKAWENQAPWNRKDDKVISKDKVKKIVFTGKNTAPVNSRDLFSRLPNLVSVEGLQNLDTSKVTNMSSMFYGGESLENLNISEWNTSKVTDLSHMFHLVSKLKELDVSKWNTSKVSDMSSMFAGTESLERIDFSEWDTSSVTNMSAMFNAAHSLKDIDVSKWNTSEVTNMEYTFSFLYSLTTLDVSRWNTSNVVNMAQMFADTRSLTTLDVSKWDTSKVTSMIQMFLHAESLKSIDVSKWETSSVTKMESMFMAANSLIELDVSKWDTSNVISMYGMFQETRALTSLNVSEWNTSKVTDMRKMFSETAIEDLDLNEWDTSKVTEMSSMFQDSKDLENLKISKWNTGNVTDAKNMFSGLKLKRITLGNVFEFKADAGLGSPAGLDGVENLTGNWIRQDGKSKGYSPTDFMANYGKNDELTAGTYVAEGDKVNEQLLWGTAPWSFDKETGTLTVESGELADKYATENPFPWKRTDDNKLLKEEIKKIEFKGKVIAPNDSTALIANLPNLEEFDLQGLDTSNVEIMTSMFALSKSLTHLDLSHFKTDKVRYMDSMFADMPVLIQLDLSSFETPNLTNTGRMFSGDTSLKSINLSSFDTSNVGLMYSMFLNNSSLTELDLSNFETRREGKVSMNDMFKGVTSLSKLKLGESFRFDREYDPHLEAPVALNSGDEVNGKWVREDENSKGYTPTDFMKYYGFADDLTPGTYVAQVSHFGFKEVPEKMSFKDTKISNRTTLTQRQDPQWKMIVEDTRPASSNWHVTAKMEEGFKDSKGNLLDSDLLLFRKNGQDDQWINSTSETMVYEGKGSPVRDDHDISWGEKEGPLIQAAPGAVKAEDYKGEITWNLVDAPL